MNNLGKRVGMIGGMLAGFVMISSILSGCSSIEQRSLVTEEMPVSTDKPVDNPTIEPTVMPTKEPIEVAKEVTTQAIGVENRSFVEWFAASYGEEVVLEIAGTMWEEGDPWMEYAKKTFHVLKDEYNGILESEELQQEHWTYVIGDGSQTKESVTLRFAGDISFSENKSTTIHMDKQKNGILDCFSEDLLTLMKDADLMMLNNEFTYSTRGKPLANKTYTYRAKPSRVDLLHELGVDIVSLANNHTYDYGEDALIDTLDTLREAEIPFVGAGVDLEEAMRPVYYIVNGRKIAIVSATQIERSTLYTKQATETAPGVLRTKDPTLFLEVIEKAKENSDYVIAYVHWGTENVDYIDPTQRPLAEQFIDAGADVVIGGHTHCLQGFEFYKGKPIVYSLGNFWFNSKTLDSALLELEIDAKGETKVTFLPCIQKNIKTSLVTNEKEKQRIIDYMQKISYDVSIDEDGVVSNKK